MIVRSFFVIAEIVVMIGVLLFNARKCGGKQIKAVLVVHSHFQSDISVCDIYCVVSEMLSDPV